MGEEDINFYFFWGELFFYLFGVLLIGRFESEIVCFDFVHLGFYSFLPLFDYLFFCLGEIFWLVCFL